MGNRRQIKLKQEREALKNSLAKAEESAVKSSSFLNLIQEYENIQEFDAAILNRLIERIVVGNKVHLGGKKYLQDVTIHYRFIGTVNFNIQDKKAIVG